jgi:hypothetical protein
LKVTIEQFESGPTLPVGSRIEAHGETFVAIRFGRFPLWVSIEYGGCYTRPQWCQKYANVTDEIEIVPGYPLGEPMPKTAVDIFLAHLRR